MSLYLTADVRHDPATIGSPPYQAFLAWCAFNSIPIMSGWQLRAYDETPVRAVLDVIDLDENDAWVVDEDGVPVTHEVTYNPAGLPPVHGHMPRMS